MASIYELSFSNIYQNFLCNSEDNRYVDIVPWNTTIYLGNLTSLSTLLLKGSSPIYRIDAIKGEFTIALVNP
jgi:hypothetical protein